VTSAQLVLSIDRNRGNWGRTGRTVDVHALLVDFDEGNGQTFRVRRSQWTRGTGSGVTWECASDADIANTRTDCAMWDGGSFAAPPTDSVLFLRTTAGEVSFDVTADVQAGTSSWLVKRTDAQGSGGVEIHSREGAAAAGDPDLAPRLVLEGCSVDPEICDGLDNDCDGQVDEGNPDGGGTCDTGLMGVCAAGTELCSSGSIVCSQDVQAAPETCGDGLDNDCDGTVDNGCAPPFDCAAAGGTVVGGIDGCWFLGAFGQSCDQACAAAGLTYSDLTRTVAGSDGTAAACDAALGALGAPTPALCDGTPRASSTGVPTFSSIGAGCLFEDIAVQQPDQCNAFPDLRVRLVWSRISSPATDGSGAFLSWRRACACQP
jgi:Putative metal-binding motif